MTFGAPQPTLSSRLGRCSGAESIGSPARLRIADSLPDPAVDIRPPVSDVLADAKSHGALPPVAPRVQGPNRQVEELGELFDGEEAVGVVHPSIFSGNPVARVPSPQARRPGTLHLASPSSAWKTRRFGPVGGFLTGLLTLG